MNKWLSILLKIKTRHSDQTVTTARWENALIKDIRWKKNFLWTRTQICCIWFIYNLNHMKSLIISLCFNMLQIALFTSLHVKNLSCQNSMELYTWGEKSVYCSSVGEKLPLFKTTLTKAALHFSSTFIS